MRERRARLLPPARRTAFRCTPTISSAPLLRERPRRRGRLSSATLFLPTFPSPPSRSPLIISCMQSAELCAWEYKKMRHRAPSTARHFAYRREFKLSFLTLYYPIKHGGALCARTHESRACNPHAPAKEARANGHHKQ